MRSMGEGHALAILTFWRGDTLNVPLHRLRRSPSPGGGGINTGRPDRPQPALGRQSLPCNVGLYLSALPSSHREPPNGRRGMQSARNASPTRA